MCKQVGEVELTDLGRDRRREAQEVEGKRTYQLVFVLASRFNNNYS